MAQTQLLMYKDEPVAKVQTTGKAGNVKSVG